MTGTIYIRGVSVPVFCRILTIVEVGIWLDPYIHAHAYDWLALAGGWCEDGGIVTSDCEARTGTAVLKPLLWSIVGNFYWKPDSYFEKWRLLSHNNNCKVQYWSEQRGSSSLLIWSNKILWNLVKYFRARVGFQPTAQFWGSGAPNIIWGAPELGTIPIS